MNPIKLFLRIAAAIILAPFIPFVALAWLAVWLTPEQQPASAKISKVQCEIAAEQLATDRKTVQSDSVFSFII